jgi:glycosyltransferase involved in cell wall biosynthesis
MKILVVVPCRNESLNLEKLLDSLNQQSIQFVSGVVIVENNSVDDTYEIAMSLAGDPQRFTFPIHVLKYLRKGNLSNAVEFQAFAHGVSHYLSKYTDTTHVMKLDADVRLQSDYFEILHKRHGTFDLAGGRLKNEQTWNVPGCLKLYSLRALDFVLELPASLGWDVIDEVLLRSHQLKVVYCTDAKYSIARVTGSSEGLLRGRRRLGLVCKFTGYTRTYFALKLFRYMFRKPYIIGSVAMLLGFLTRDKSPFSPALISSYRMEQQSKLKELTKDPIQWLKSTYR